MTPHSSTLSWSIHTWTEEPGDLQSMVSQRVRYDCASESYDLFSRAGT